MGKNTNSTIGEGGREHSRNEGQVPTINILNVSIVVLALIKRKEVVQISQPTEHTLRIYCRPSLNNKENQAIRKFLENSYNLLVNIKRDPWLNFIDFEMS